MKILVKKLIRQSHSGFKKYELKAFLARKNMIKIIMLNS